MTVIRQSRRSTDPVSKIHNRQVKNMKGEVMFWTKRKELKEDKADKEEMRRFKEDVGEFPALLRARADDLERQIAFSKPEFLILQTEYLKAVIEKIASDVSWVNWRVDMFENARNRQLLKGTWDWD